MLQAIRDRAHSWIVAGIIILFCIPFALYGINYYFQGGGKLTVASVNGEDISEADLQRAYQNRLQALSAQFGGRVADLIDEASLRRETLEGMIREEVVRQAVASSGYRVSDAQVAAAIQQNPAFQRDGRFDEDVFRRVLRNQGMSEDMFVARMRTALAVGQMTEGVLATAFATPIEVDRMVRLQDQQRDVSFFVLPVERYREGIQVTEDQVATYYREHEQLFQEPERVQVSYVELDAKTLGASFEPSEDDLRRRYEEEKDQFRAEEERRASHILFEVPAGADDASVEAAKAKAEEVLQRIRSGEDFATLAKEVSQDPGSAQEGGDLGFFGRGVMDPAFETAVFQMQPGEVSELVRSSFGFHIIKLVDIQPEHTKSFEEVRDSLLAELRAREGERLFYEQAETLANLAYEHPDSLEPAAAALGLTIQDSDWLTLESGEGIAAEQKVREAAFRPEVLGGEVNSDPIELAPDRVVILRVKARQEAHLKPLEAVKDQVVERLRNEEARKKAREEGTELLARLQEPGADIKAVAEEAGGELKSYKGLKRDSTEVDPLIVQQAFRAPRPDKGPSYVSTELGSGDFAVIAVSEVRDGSPEGIDASRRRQLEQQMGRTAGSGQLSAFVENLRERADVETR